MSVSEWIEIRVCVTPSTEEAVANFLCEAGSNGVAMIEAADSKQTVVACFPAGKQADGMVEAVRNYWQELCRLGLAAGPCECTIRPLPSAAWTRAWQKHFKPVSISERLLVKPPWVDVAESTERIVIEIEPGMAFGTGEHETTRLCLSALERHVSAGARVLDVGTGSGILAIAAAKLGAQEVVAIEVDEAAIENARNNCIRNGVHHRVRICRGSLDPYSITGPFQVIVSNIDRRTLLPFFEMFARLLDPAGVVILSGILDSERHAVGRHLRAHAFTLVEQSTMGAWWAGIATARGA